MNLPHSTPKSIVFAHVLNSTIPARREMRRLGIALLGCAAIALGGQRAPAQTSVLTEPVVTPPNSFTPPNFPIPTFPPRHYNVKDFGAQGNGSANDTQAFDQAIQKANSDGGGIVDVPSGTYMVASVQIMSNVELALDDSATLKGLAGAFDAPEPNPYDKFQDFGHDHFHTGLLWGENIDNFAIVGGTIHGGAITHGTPKQGGGDKQIAIKVGRNILIQGVHHINGGHFVYLLNDCQNVTIANDTVVGSRDAIDLMNCSNVQVHDCHYTDCEDDTLGIKTDYALGKTITSSNIYAWNDYFESGCNGVQFGSETAGDFQSRRFAGRAQPQNVRRLQGQFVKSHGRIDYSARSRAVDLQRDKVRGR